MIGVATLELTLLIFRMAGLGTFLPVFNDGRLPRSVKVGFSMVLGWTIMSVESPESRLVSDLATDPSNTLRILLAIASEFFFGASMGFTFSLLFEPVKIAGAYISQEIGLTLAEMTDPTSQHSTNVVTQLLVSLAILLFFAGNMHHVVLDTVKTCITLHPLGKGFSPMTAATVANHTDAACESGLLIASPVGIAGFVTVVCLALLMRAVPQMNIFTVGLTLRLGIGLFSLILFLPVILRLLKHMMIDAVHSVEPLTQVIG